MAIDVSRRSAVTASQRVLETQSPPDIDLLAQNCVLAGKMFSCVTFVTSFSLSSSVNRIKQAFVAGFTPRKPWGLLIIYRMPVRGGSA